ncbi:hypothetical protein L0B52_06615 [Suttonella sp. R2A3]|uniref:hypothetical protein n=1 Tax=Suttonella sp. R2A3 TaxID=2908648 RepID=UPI001F395FEF|nr:hypothetical protein [Suttonella sp. R2A3]UJF24009.1 hypothetical protein L0B52_06615 [Suttonella sp. R2A3]
MSDVQLMAEINLKALEQLLGRFGLCVSLVADGAAIPGTYWGEPEAGLITDTLYIRRDTPVHSALHEAGHWICMDEARRAGLHTDAGGTVLEECAVNYVQILLAEQLEGVGRKRMLDDMNAWGYSYREGSVQAWLKGDAADARAWLVERNMLTHDEQLITQS